MTLAIKYRPKSFADVKGQDATIKVLTGMLKQQTPAQAFIFAGDRGTGKTTVGRLLAKAVNCEKGITPQPCQKCSSCLAIDNLNSMDLLEIDAATNRGINDIRELQSEINYLPDNRFRIVLLDEAHQLSKEAFNALLKTLEEPPEHVIFILATTEYNKIPKTVQSRCQTMFFKNISPKAILEILAQVVKEENIVITKSAAMELARNCDGSARDTLFLLEQLTFSKEGDSIELEDVQALLEDFSEVAFNLIEALKEKNTERILQMLHTYFEANSGQIRPLLYDVMRLLRAVLITKTCYDYKKILNPSEKQIKLFNMLARNWDEGHLIDMLQEIFEAFKNLELGIGDRMLAEMIFLQAMRE